MMAVDPIKVEGLSEFVRNLRKLDSDLPKAVRLALNTAGQVVVDEAVRDIPKRTGRAARSVKSRSTRMAVRVVGGGARAAYYPWLDFGGRVGRHRSVVRRFYSDGRYIYAAYYRKRDSGEFEAVMTQALLDVVRQAGIEVT